MTDDGTYLPVELLSDHAPDPVRVVALANAVDLVARSALRPDESDTARATRIVHVATMFEAYLTEKETDGAT